MTALLLVVALAWAAPNSAQQTTVERLAGRWSGSGSVNGQRVTAEANFERVLQGRFTRLQYKFTDAGRAIFEGHGYYSCESATCRGQWFDSQGSQHVLTGALTSDTLTSEWGDGTMPRGRTEYKLAGPTSLIVTDWIRTAAGEWREFGRVEYRRD